MPREDRASADPTCGITQATSPSLQLPHAYVSKPRRAPSQSSMADQVDPALSSSLSAPGPAQQLSTHPQPAQHREGQPLRSGPRQEPLEGNAVSNPIQTTANGRESARAPTSGAADGTEKLSPAEMKKKAKAEKTARRAREKQDREQAGGGGGGGGGPPGQSTPSAKKTQPGKDQKPHPRRGSAQSTTQAGTPEQKKKKEDKNVAVFGHLYGQQRRTTIAGAGKEVHPAVLALGLQMRDYVICGSSARCVATMLAFKRVWSPFLLLLYWCLWC